MSDTENLQRVVNAVARLVQPFCDAGQSAMERNAQLQADITTLSEKMTAANAEISDLRQTCDTQRMMLEAENADHKERVEREKPHAPRALRFRPSERSIIDSRTASFNPCYDRAVFEFNLPNMSTLLGVCADARAGNIKFSFYVGNPDDTRRFARKYMIIACGDFEDAATHALEMTGITLNLNGRQFYVFQFLL